MNSNIRSFQFSHHRTKLNLFWFRFYSRDNKFEYSMWDNIQPKLYNRMTLYIEGVNIKPISKL